MNKADVFIVLYNAVVTSYKIFAEVIYVAFLAVSKILVKNCSFVT